MNLNDPNSSQIAKTLIQILDFINGYVVPLVFALAFIFFLFGVFRYFFAGTNDEKRKEGRTFILWGVIALAIMIAVWGLVNLVVNSLGFNNQSRPCLPTFTGSGNCTQSVPGSNAGSSGSTFNSSVTPSGSTGGSATAAAPGAPAGFGNFSGSGTGATPPPGTIPPGFGPNGGGN